MIEWIRTSGLSMKKFFHEIGPRGREYRAEQHPPVHPLRGLVFGVWCLVCGACSLGFGFGVWNLGFRIQGSGFRVQGLGFEVWGLGFRVYGLWFQI